MADNNKPTATKPEKEAQDKPEDQNGEAVIRFTPNQRQLIRHAFAVATRNEQQDPVSMGCVYREIEIMLGLVPQPMAMPQQD